MKKSCFSILASLLAIGLAGAAGEVLLEDNFETAFSPKWAVVSNEIEIVADETEPGNHVARFTDTNQRLVSIPKNLQQAEELSEEVAQWENYEVRFRFRLGQIELDPTHPKTHSTLFGVLFNVSPNEDNPAEKRLFYVQLHRHGDRVWRVSNPRIPWYGSQQDLENVLHRKTRWDVPSDTEWHTLRIRSEGPLSTIYFDDEEIHRGEDSRATFGGIEILSWWDEETISPGWIDIDDVKVSKLP